VVRENMEKHTVRLRKYLILNIWTPPFGSFWWFNNFIPL